jgi:DNA invertase Pin-like site-specific DNA recombinase
MISERTRAALAAAKARGTALGGFRGRAGTRADLAKARASRTAKANQRALDLAATIRSLQAEGSTSLGSIATALNSRQIATARGGGWSAAQVQRILNRLEDQTICEAC